MKHWTSEIFVSEKNLFNIQSKAINCASALSRVLVQQLLQNGHVQESYGVQLTTNEVILRNMFDFKLSWNETQR